MAELLFSKPEVQEQFDREGYVILDLLEYDEINALSDMYLRIFGTNPDVYGFRVGLYMEDDQQVKNNSPISHCQGTILKQNPQH